MRTAILGAGSLGTIIGGLITRNGGNVILIDGYKEHVEALNQRGATITGEMKANIPVKACMLQEISGIFDLVLYIAKATNNPMYLPAILPHLHGESIVCTLQNGLPEDVVAKYVGREGVVGATVGWGASLRGPGVSELTSPPSRQFYDLGEPDGSITPRLAEIKKILDLAGYCEIITNLSGVRWSKLLMNAAFSGMSAALGCTYGEILHNKKALFCAACIADELIKAAHAQGIRMARLQGEDFAEFELKRGREDFESKIPLYTKVFAPHEKVIASMLFDLRLGKKTEIEAINGAVVSRGLMVGIDTPFNNKVVELVKEAENEGTVTSFANLERFDKIIAQGK